MQLIDYIGIIWRRKWVVIATVAAAMLVAILGTWLTAPTYEAITTLRVASLPDSSGNYTDSSSLLRLLNTYTRIATTQPVLDQLNQQLGIALSPKIDVNIIPDTELFQIAVDDPNPTLAVNAANSLAKILIDQSEAFYTGTGKTSTEILSQQLTEVEKSLADARQNYQDLLAKTPRDTAGINIASKSVDLQQQIYVDLLQQYEQARTRETLRATTVSIVEPATAPKAPIKPNKLLNLSLALIGSLVLGFGLVLVFQNLDTRVYTSAEIEAITKEKVIAKLPDVHNPSERQIPLDLNSPLGDGFVRLRAKLVSAGSALPLRTILVTSAEKGEGKSTVVSNLAYCLAEAGQMVAVVDCDMRLPKMHKHFGLDNARGLSDFLNFQANLEDVIRGTDNINVNVITSGATPNNPSRLLSSQGMESLINMLGGSYHFILLDAPSLLACADASLLAPLADGVIFVAKRGVVRRENLAAATRLLGEIHANILGLVINNENLNNSYYEYHHRQPAPIEEK
jgi:polysaccharide biosynthesis transport protein